MSMRDLLNDLETGKLLSDPDPVKRAQLQMRTALPKRFYTEVSVAAGDGGFQVHLDGKPVRTPAKALLAFPTAQAAQRVADEFAAQVETIDLLTMPSMRLVNTAIDGVANEADAVAEDILRFASSDMLCYRADGPDGLVARQNAAWDPVLDFEGVRRALRACRGHHTRHATANLHHGPADSSRPAPRSHPAGRAAFDDLAHRLRPLGACR